MLKWCLLCSEDISFFVKDAHADTSPELVTVYDFFMGIAVGLSYTRCFKRADSVAP